jgi:hypothetical protein
VQHCSYGISNIGSSIGLRRTLYNTVHALFSKKKKWSNYHVEQAQFDSLFDRPCRTTVIRQDNKLTISPNRPIFLRFFIKIVLFLKKNSLLSPCFLSADSVTARRNDGRRRAQRRNGPWPPIRLDSFGAEFAFVEKIRLTNT